jgi:SAM-dependent methyltransferase
LATGKDGAGGPGAGEADEAFTRWMNLLASRFLADLTMPEVTRALRALSSAYVERRGRLSRDTTLGSAGKRAAFALFYAPLHYLLVRGIVRALPGATRTGPDLVDLGCGTGAAGAAWGSIAGRRPRIVGVDRSSWAVGEAARTYRAFGLAARVERAEAARAPFAPRCAVVAAFTLNELPAEDRDQLLARLLDRRSPIGQLLVIEPIAGFVTPWWPAWREAITAVGGRHDEWRIVADLPPLVATLDRAAGLNHRSLTARSLWLSRSKA